MRSVPGRDEVEDWRSSLSPEGHKFTLVLFSALRQSVPGIHARYGAEWGEGVIVELEEDDYQLLICALGIAAGYADPKGVGTRTGNRLLELANKMNANNPKYKVDHAT